MSDHEHDHDHDHDRSRATASRRPRPARGALEALLVEKGVVSARTCARDRLARLALVRPTAPDSSRARGSIRSSRSACSRTRARLRSSSTSTRARRPSSSPSRTRKTCTTWSSARSARAIRVRCSARRRTGTRVSRTVHGRSRIRTACSRSSGSSWTTTWSCGCSTRRPTSDISYCRAVRRERGVDRGRARRAGDARFDDRRGSTGRAGACLSRTRVFRHRGVTDM